MAVDVPNQHLTPYPLSYKERGNMGYVDRGQPCIPRQG